MHHTDPDQPSTPRPLPDIATCLQEALDTLDRASTFEVDAWTGAVQDSQLARAIAARSDGTLLTHEQVDVQYDRRVLELVGAGVYRDTIRDHLTTALQLIRISSR